MCCSVGGAVAETKICCFLLYVCFSYAWQQINWTWVSNSHEVIYYLWWILTVLSTKNLGQWYFATLMQVWILYLSNIIRIWLCILVQNYTYRKLIRAGIFLLPTLGATWIFGVLAVNSEHVAFAWIFTILNSIEVYTVCT